MDIYKIITVNDLIKRTAVTDLYKGKVGFVYADNKSHLFEEIKDTNIDAYYFLLVQEGTAHVEIDMCTMDMHKNCLLYTSPSPRDA